MNDLPRVRSETRGLVRRSIHPTRDDVWAEWCDAEVEKCSHGLKVSILLAVSENRINENDKLTQERVGRPFHRIGVNPKYAGCSSVDLCVADDWK